MLSVVRGPSKRQTAALTKLQKALEATREAWRLTVEAYTNLNEIKKADDTHGRKESPSQGKTRSHVRHVASKTEACWKELHFAHHVYAQQLQLLKRAADAAPRPTIDNPAFSDGEDSAEYDDDDTDPGQKRRKTAHQ